MNKPAIIETEAVTTDFAHLGRHVVRVRGNGRCPFCLRRRLRASDVREIEAGGLAWTCSACRCDILTVTVE